MGNRYEEFTFDSNTQEDDEAMAYRFMALSGEDRGARINITGSTFKHSKFCKGLLTYRRQPEIKFSESKTFVNITAGFDRKFNVSDNRNESFIVIDRSNFTNIGYHFTL